MKGSLYMWAGIVLFSVFETISWVKLNPSSWYRNGSELGVVQTMMMMVEDENDVIISTPASDGNRVTFFEEHRTTFFEKKQPRKKQEKTEDEESSSSSSPSVKVSTSINSRTSSQESKKKNNNNKKKPSQESKETSKTNTNDNDDSDEKEKEKKQLTTAVPEAIIQRYIKQHSHQTLEKEIKECEKDGVSPSDCLAHRNFGVAYYSCPNQAGNRIHHFLNGIGWSIVTNRTVLWKYYDAETCRDVGAGHLDEICNAANTKKDCDLVLGLADWIPSFDEWTDRLGLPEKQKVPYWSTHLPPKNGIDKRKDFARLRHPWHEGDEKYSGVDKNETRVARFGQMHTRELMQLKKVHNREYLLHTEASRKIAEGLVSEGGAFLYGTMFQSLFTFQESVLPDPKQIEDFNNKFTVALHSRHLDGKDDGANIQPETKCLVDVFKHANPPTGECSVYLMSDRSLTLKKLKKLVEETHGCNTVIVPHVKATGLNSEQGPFAGAGFFQDLALASNARHAFIGHRRSSSLLLEALVAVGRHKDGFDKVDVPMCDMGSTRRGKERKKL